jgi:uncharacterized membrane protein
MKRIATLPGCLLAALLLASLWSCESDSRGRHARESAPADRDTMAIREATDPVPEPPALPSDTSGQAAQLQGVHPAGEVLYRITGTEPFWSLTISTGSIIYRSMEGDSSRFAYREPVQAAGRQQEWVQLYQLDRDAWLLLRKGNSPCSDGMSDKEWAYMASLWIRGRLLDGCGEKR